VKNSQLDTLLRALTLWIGSDDARRTGFAARAERLDSLGRQLLTQLVAEQFNETPERVRLTLEANIARIQREVLTQAQEQPQGTAP
jgi:hypothetical protein